MRWLGHILRDELRRKENNKHSGLVYQAIWEQHQTGKRVNMLMDALQLPDDLMKTAKNKSKWKKLGTKIGASKTTRGPEFNGMSPNLPTPRKEVQRHQQRQIFPNATAASVCHQLLTDINEESQVKRCKTHTRTHVMKTRSMRTKTTTSKDHKKNQPILLSASVPSFAPPLVLK